MAEILRRMDAKPWRRALEEVVADEDVQRRLTGFIGPDFVYGLPWDEIKTVLDVGSSMGAMAALLAERAKVVVALEPVPERALFQRKRAAQDGFSNWHPLIAGGTAPPFPPETFDLITLNGSFERLGLWSEGDPEELQRRLLSNAFRLLKPGGFLCVGAGNRLALSAILGTRDRSGLPRPDANRLRKWTPKQYGRMFARAGFGSVEVFGVFGGLDRQKAVYRLRDVGPRRATRELADPPASWKGRLIRWIENAGSLCGAIENEVVVFGSKSAKAGPLTWAGLGHDGPVTQFSSSDKVFALCFKDGPESVFKGPKTEVAVASLAREYAFLQDAERRHGAEAESWPLRWTKPLGTRQVNGQTFYRYEFARGRSLAVELLPVSFDLARFSRLISRLIEDYAGLCAKLTAAAPSGAPENSWDELLDRLSTIRIDDEACAEAIRAACGKLRGRKWRTSLTHGDLSLNNTTLLSDESMVLVDWENAAVGGLVAIDLMRLLYDVRDESGLLKPAQRRAVLERTKRPIREALARMGVGPEEYGDVEALFVAHQFHLWLSREPGSGTSSKARNLLRRYRDRESSLTE
jgi:SAM-dependent methyltransferase